jgi:hypothetical protein
MCSYRHFGDSWLLNMWKMGCTEKAVSINPHRVSSREIEFRIHGVESVKSRAVTATCPPTPLETPLFKSNLNFQSLEVSLRTTRFKITKFYMVLALRWVFYADLRTDSGFALYIINWLVFIAVVESVYSVVRTESLNMCFVFIWERTATCATYSINWLVFITEMKSVCSAVRTYSLYKADYVSSFKG